MLLEYTQGTLFHIILQFCTSGIKTRNSSSYINSSFPSKNFQNIFRCYSINIYIYTIYDFTIFKSVGPSKSIIAKSVEGLRKELGKVFIF